MSVYRVINLSVRTELKVGEFAPENNQHEKEK